MVNFRLIYVHRAIERWDELMDATQWCVTMEEFDWLRGEIEKFESDPIGAKLFTEWRPMQGLWEAYQAARRFEMQAQIRARTAVAA